MVEKHFMHGLLEDGRSVALALDQISSFEQIERKIVASNGMKPTPTIRVRMISGKDYDIVAKFQDLLGAIGQTIMQSVSLEVEVAVRTKTALDTLLPENGANGENNVGGADSLEGVQSGVRLHLAKPGNYEGIGSQLGMEEDEE